MWGVLGSFHFHFHLHAYLLSFLSSEHIMCVILEDEMIQSHPLIIL